MMSAKSKKSELQEVKQKLENDGLDPSCSDEDKLLHLWRVYSKVENDLAAALEETEQIKLRSEEEMNEVENYVKHIRSLSDEREALTIEFENENDHLKQEIINLHAELQAQNKNDETCEMLQEQGLEEISAASVAEQVAYLLVERARLLDELEAEQARNVLDTPDGPMTAQQILGVLDQERTDFEEELSEQRDSMRAVKEQMKSMHEEEMNSLVSENQRLQQLLDEANVKINSLDLVLNSMQENLNDRMEQAVAELRASATPTPEVTEGGQEVKELQIKVQTMEDDNRTLINNLKVTECELESERSQHAHTVNLKERTTRRLQIEIDQQKQTIEVLEASDKQLTDDRETLRGKVKDLEQEVERLERSKEPSILTQTKSEEFEDEERHSRLKTSLRTLQSQKSQAEQELEDLQQVLGKERDQVQKLEQQAESMEEEARNQRRNFDKKESDLRAKIKSLETHVQTLEDEVNTRDRQHQLSERDFKKVLSNLRMELEIEQGKVKQEQKRRNHMEANFNEHRMTNTNHVLDLETSMSQLQLSMTEVKTKLQHVTEERDQLLKDLESQEVEQKKLSQKTSELSGQVDWLENTSSLLAEENTQLHQQVKAVEKGVETEQQKRCTELEIELEELREENNIVHSQLRDRDTTIAQLKLQLSDENLVKSQLREKEESTALTTTTQQQQSAQLERQIHELTSQLTTKDEDIDTITCKLKDEIGVLSKQLSTSEQEVKQTREELTGKLEEVVTLKTQLCDVKAQDPAVEGLKHELCETKARCETLEQNCETLRQKSETSAQKCEALQGECGELEGKCEGLQEKCETLEKKCESLQGKCEEWEDKCETLEEEGEGLRSQVEKMQGVEDKLQEQQNRVQALQGVERRLQEQQTCVQALTCELTDLQNSSSTQSTNHDLQVSRLKTSHEAKVKSLCTRIDELRGDNTRLNDQLNNVRQDLTLTRRELTNQKTDGNKEHNSVLQQTLTKREQEVTELKATVSKLESSKSRLQSELSRKKREFGELESRLSSQNIDQNSVLIQTQSRAQDAEQRATRLQEELARALSRLETSESRGHEVTSLKHDLHLKDKQITELRNSLHEEQLNKVVASQSSSESRVQLTQFRDREKSLQSDNDSLKHALVDLEGKLDAAQEKIRTQTELRSVAEVTKHTSSLQIIELEKQVDKLKGDVRVATDMYDVQLARYEERKLRTKEKLQRAREWYHADKQKIKEELEKARHEISLTNARLQAEFTWKETMESSQSKLITEKRDLLAQIIELESLERDHIRGMSLAGVKVKYLEEENTSLQQRVDSLTLQKHNLERVLKDYQTDRCPQEHQQELTSSPGRDILDNHNHQANLVSAGVILTDVDPAGNHGDCDDTMISSMSEVHSDISAT